MTDPSRRRVTFAQLEQLFEYLSCKRDIAMGYNKSAQAREYSRRAWEEIALGLNSHGGGAVKDGKAWCKYWVDYKSKLKKLAAASRASLQRTGGGPSTVKQLSDIELKFLQILGEDFGSGISGARVEPFPEVLQEQQEMQLVSTESSTPASTSILPNTWILSGLADLEVSMNEAGPSGVVAHAPPVCGTVPAAASPPLAPPVAAPSAPPVATPSATPPPPAPTSSPPLRTSPLRHQAAEGHISRGSPRRRRRFRREPPMTAEASRRALVRVSEQRLEIEERQIKCLEELVVAVREMKEAIQSRLAGHPRGDELGSS